MPVNSVSNRPLETPVANVNGAKGQFAPPQGGELAAAPHPQTRVQAPVVQTANTTPRNSPLASDLRSPQALEQLIDRISEQLVKIERRSISFQLNETLGRTVVSVVDIESDEVIRQIPSEELVRIAEVLHELNQRLDSNASADSVGLLFEDSA